MNGGRRRRHDDDSLLLLRWRRAVWRRWLNLDRTQRQGPRRRRLLFVEKRGPLSVLVYLELLFIFQTLLLFFLRARREPKTNEHDNQHDHEQHPQC